MAKFNIKKDSVKLMGNVKTSMTVTFIDEMNGKPDQTQYHEVESVDVDVVNAELQRAADEYEARSPGVVSAPALETNKAMKIQLSK